MILTLSSGTTTVVLLATSCCNQGVATKTVSQKMEQSVVSGGAHSGTCCVIQCMPPPPMRMSLDCTPIISFSGNRVCSFFTASSSQFGWLNCGTTTDVLVTQKFTQEAGSLSPSVQVSKMKVTLKVVSLNRKLHSGGYHSLTTHWF